MAQTRGIFPELNDNIDKTFSAIMKDRLKELPKIYTRYYATKTSDRKFERIVSYVPFGDVPTKAEGAAYTMDTLEPGYTKDFTHTEFGLGFEVTQTAFEDDPENILARCGEWLSFSARYVQEGRAANVINNGHTTETTPDGGALFSSHTIKSGGTARNVLSASADLSATSLMQALADMQTQTKDEAGHLAAPIDGLILLIPPDLEFLADRLLNSALLPQSADNDRNPIKARRTWDIVVNPRLTDTDQWTIIASNKGSHGLTFYQRVPITVEPMVVDPRTGNKIFKCRHRFSVGAWCWQGTFGSPGA